jgi:uncharacterized metal-binding protein YceD (DUF177 family)
MKRTVVDVFVTCLHQPLVPARLPKGPQPFSVSATSRDCDWLAQHVGVERLSDVAVEGTIEVRGDGTEMLVKGRVRAEVEQRCVVTLEPVLSSIDESFARSYSAALRDEWDMYDESTEEIFIDLEEEGGAEPFPAAGLTLAAIVAEELALAIDPYPRSPSARARVTESHPPRLSQASNDETIKPFANLAQRLSKR